jgi:hypothetical protein
MLGVVFLRFDKVEVLTSGACLSACPIYTHEKHFKVNPQTQDQKFARNAFSFSFQIKRE